MSPKETFQFLNKFYSSMSAPIERHNGFIDKFLGDGIMALFDRSATDALNSAIDMRYNLRVFNEERKTNGNTPIQVGIGINTGDLILGTVGSDRRIDGTVVGDAVNIASRLEGLTSIYGVGIVISDNTFQALEAPSQFQIRELDMVRVYGKEKPVKIYEVFDMDEDETKEQKQKSLPIFIEGIDLYRQGQWEDTIDKMTECASICPEDNVAKDYLRRCEQYKKQPPAADWDGSIVLNEK